MSEMSEGLKMEENRKAQLLKLLRSRDAYVSGQELCEQFGVSRTAVWKMINQLKEEGYEIEAVSNRGYCLKSAPDLTSPEEITSRLTTDWAGRTVYHFGETGSTNIDAKRLADEGAPHGTLVVADTQTMGRGRRGRGWESEDAGKAVYMTLLLKPQFSPEYASRVTLLMAMAVTAALEEVCEGQSVQIKWPNDVVINGRKACGILTEMSAEPGYIHHVVIGTGINVNQSSFPKEIEQTAASVLRETGKMQSRALIIARVMFFFEQYYECFVQTHDLSALREQYEAHLAGIGREVRVLDPKGEYTGVSKGITDSGELIVEKEDGTRVEVYAGEVSVRGLYGYTA
jgi:BirA family biotin operon repressor/biotin-[acetyl-CoA-carboxylase] ligase